MKRIYLAALLLLCLSTSYAQNNTVSIHDSWIRYATDTTLTYQQITHVCDSLFAMVGYTDTATVSDTSDASAEFGERDGSPHVLYLRWRNFWATRCDSTGKLHNFVTEALNQITQQGRTTSAPTYCAGTSDLQSSFPGTPRGWQFIGPRNISTPFGLHEDHGNSLRMFLGQINEIVVNESNRSEIYIRDQWGGVWKTNNANQAPNNTWTCLSDNLPHIAGIGVTEMHVDLSTSPHRIYCVMGVSPSLCLPNTTENVHPTVGIYYSLDDGSTFTRMDISAAIPDLANNPIQVMKYWRGNDSSTTNKYLFIASIFKVFRLDITNPAAVACSTIINLTSSVINDERHKRFKGFTDIEFSSTTPSTMYVSTLSNLGYPFGHTSEVFRVTNCAACTTCTYTTIPNQRSDYLIGTGDFDGPDEGWIKTETIRPGESILRPDWEHNNSSGKMECKYLPALSGTYATFEKPIVGSYFHPMFYEIKFTLWLPARTAVDVKLKDVHSTYIYTPDFGSTTPAALGGNYNVGHFENTDSSGVLSVSVTYTVTATDYVSRLEFGASQLSGYSFSGNFIELDSVEVNTEFYDKINNLQHEGTLMAATEIGDRTIRKIRLTTDDGSTYPSVSYDNPSTADRFIPSPTHSGTLYSYLTQSHDTERVIEYNITGVPSFTLCTTSRTMLHADVRSVVALPGASTKDSLYLGTDGGLALGSILGPWKNLNGTNLATSWAYDIGSSLYTGQVGIAATDNGCMWSSNTGYGNWEASILGDGGQLKYGKRLMTKNIRFEGYSSGSGFDHISGRYLGGLPTVRFSTGPGILYVKALPFGKMAVTNSAEYFSSGPTDCEIFRYDRTLGSGAIADSFEFEVTNLTTDSSYNIKNNRVQAIAPDMYDADYIAVYAHKNMSDQGFFAYCTNATSVTPTWHTVDNHHALSDAPSGTAWQSLSSLVADPRSPRHQKRLWAGAVHYGTANSKRVFQGIDVDPSSPVNMVWSDMSHGLPSGPVHVLVYDDQSHYLFAGTDQGIYAFNVDNGANSPTNKWQCYSLNMPSNFITGLDINRCTGKIYASSYGRGAYAADLPPVPNNTGTGTAGPTDNIDINYVTSNATWTGEKWENRTVYVKTGVTLTLSGATLYMGKDKYIVVEPGAKLVVNNSRLTTSCGCLWGGIQAWGQNWYAQLPAYQAVVQIDNSIIEYAVTGVSNSNPADGVVNMEGGIIKVRNSKFLNNITSVLMRPFLNYVATLPHTALPDLSNFVNTEFSINNDYKLHPTPVTQLRHVQLFGVRGVQFMGCHFTNYHSSFRGHYTGIYAFNAGCKVIPHCVAIDPYGTGCASGYNPSSFRGLARGIHVAGTELSIPYHDISIDNTIFDTVGIGVHIHTHRAVSVTRSTFHIGNSSSNPFVEGVGSLGVPSSCGRNVGILAQNALLFKIEGNTFTGHSNSFGISPWHNIGVLTANAGNATNRIYRNAFTSLTYGVLGVGNMAYNHPSISGTGLQVSCNTFSNNTNDIYSGGSLTHQGIGINQIGPSGSGAGNTFSGSTRNIVNPNLTRPLYYYNDFGSSVTTTGNVTLINAGTATCSSSLPSGTGGGVGGLIRAPLTSLSNATMFTKKATYFSTKARRDSISFDLATAIDLGNTNALRYFIDTCTNADTLFGKLTDVSPFLSRSVMDRIIIKTIQVGTAYYQPLIDVMALNPEVISDYTYLKKAEQDLSMSTNDFDMLWDIATTTISARGEIELAKGIEQATIDAAISDVVLAIKSPIDTNISLSDTTFEGICLDTASIYYLTDTNSSYIHLDSLDTWLALMGSNEATHERIGLRLAAGSYQQAAGMFNSLGYAAYNGDTTPTEQQEYSMLWDVLYNAATSGRSVFHLSNSDIANLSAPMGIDIAANAARSSAAYLVHGSPYILFPCSAAPASGKNGNNEYIKHPGINNTTANKKDKLKAYPNPSDGMVTFQYQPSGMGTDDITITVLNVLGEKVLQQNIESTTSRLQWNAAQLPSGIYLFTGTNSKGTIIGKGKIVLNR